MRKVHILCGKLDETATEFWILGVFASKKRAQLRCERMNELSPLFFHYVFSEELE